mgnify:CR=1 FL=1
MGGSPEMREKGYSRNRLRQGNLLLPRQAKIMEEIQPEAPLRGGKRKGAGVKSESDTES